MVACGSILQDSECLEANREESNAGLCFGRHASNGDILDLKWSPVMERIELNIAMQISFYSDL